MNHVKKTDWESYNWGIERKINTKNVANYNFIDTEVTSVIIKDALGHADHLYFVLPGPKRSGHVPKGYEWVDNGVEYDRTITINLGAQPKSNTISQPIKPTNVATKDDVINTSDDKKAIPSDTLRKLKVLYDQGVLTEEEFKEKKKQILNI